MKRRNILFVFIIVPFSICFISCKDRAFPPVKDLSLYKKTNFILTIEDSLDKTKNNIYSASFLYAWAEIQKKLGKIEVDNKYVELTKVNTSHAYKNSLNDDEIETKISVEGLNVNASASFKKSLPFDIKLVRFGKLIFQNENVKSFGFDGDTKESVVSQILFYNNDSDFVIRLNPKNKDHEIILYYPPTDSLYTFKEILTSLNSKIDIGKKEMNSGNESWKYDYKESDVVKIPVLNFNIETQYETLIGKIFKSSNQNYTITKAEQSTAFILDELGAEIESKATAEGDGACLPPVAEHPKRMIFNKPFLIILKRRDAVNPYFMAWIQNGEVMTKN